MRVLLLALSVLLPATDTLAALDPISLAEDERNFQAPALVQGAASTDAKVRARVAIALGRIRAPESADTLLKLANDSDKSVMRAALFSLGQLGWSKTTSAGREKELADAIAPKLKHSDLNLRLAAIEATSKLFHSGTESSLMALLADSSAKVREETLHALYVARNVARNRGEAADATPPYSDADLQKVMRLLNTDKNEAVREKAAYLLSRLKDKRAWQSVLQGSRDKKLWVRYFSTIAVGDASDPADVDTYRALVRLAKDDSYLVRVEALRAAAKLSLIRKVHDLMFATLSKDPSVHVRGALVDAMKAEASIPETHVEYFLKDSSRLVRGKALRAVAARKKDAAILHLESAMLDRDWWVRSQAVAAAAASLDGAKETFLINAIQDPAPQVVQEAIGALAEMKSEAAIAAVNEALRSPELSVRYQGVYGLSIREESSRYALIWETYERSLDRKFTELRTDLVSLLAEAEDEADRAFAEEKLRAIAASDPSRSVAYQAYRALRAWNVENLPEMEAPGPERMPESEAVYSRNPTLILDTSRGRVTIELYYDRAPRHAAAIAGFALKGGYDSLPWHRVESNFVVQGGDPDRTGFSSGDYSLRHEINGTRYTRGTLGMPRASSWDSGGIQLFITHVPTPNLDGLYTVFGQVKTGMDVVDRLEQGDLILKATVKK